MQGSHTEHGDPLVSLSTEGAGSNVVSEHESLHIEIRLQEKASTIQDGGSGQQKSHTLSSSFIGLIMHWSVVWIGLTSVTFKGWPILKIPSPTQSFCHAQNI